MRISIVVYDTATINRIKEKTYNFLIGYGGAKESGDVIWGDDVYVRFQQQLIILNSFYERHDVYTLFQRYLYSVLKGEEVAIIDGENIEYNACYGEKPKLLVTYNR